MKPWEKILLDPATYTVLKQLRQPKTHQQLSEDIGINKDRTQKILENLSKHSLIQKIKEGAATKYVLKNNHDKIKQLRLDIEDYTTLEVENQVKKRNYRQALENLHINPPVKNKQKRKTIAKIEALQKIEALNSENSEKPEKHLLHNLKKYTPFN